MRFFNRLVLILLILCSSCYASENIVEYTTISESEWNIDLILKSNKTLKVIVSSWKPGAPEKVSKKEISGVWIMKGDKYIFTVNNITSEYQIVKSLYFSGDMKGAGLKFLKSGKPNSVMSKHNFWKKPIPFLE